MSDDIFESMGQAEFNSGIAIIYRLNTIHQQLHINRVSRNFEMWFEWLISFYMELYRFVPEKDEKALEDKMEEMIRAMTNIKTLIKQGKSVSISEFSSFYEVEKMLVKLEQKNGLGMNKNDPRFSLGR